MHKRYGVILVMYDLPVSSKLDRNDSEKFRKKLIQNGYCFVQKSIYAKLVRNRATIKKEIFELKKEIPKNGCINILPLCLEDFKKWNPFQ